MLLQILIFFRLPWNQNTLYGYIGEILFTYFSCESYLFVNGPIVVLFVSMCLHHRAFYEMFNYSLHEMDVPNKKKNDKLELWKIIQFQNLVKE